MIFFFTYIFFKRFFIKCSQRGAWKKTLNTYIILNLYLPCAEQILYKFGSVSNAHQQPDDISAIITLASIEARTGPGFSQLEQRKSWLSGTDCLQTPMRLLLTSFCSDVLEMPLPLTSPSRRKDVFPKSRWTSGTQGAPDHLAPETHGHGNRSYGQGSPTPGN